MTHTAKKHSKDVFKRMHCKIRRVGVTDTCEAGEGPVRRQRLPAVGGRTRWSAATTETRPSRHARCAGETPQSLTDSAEGSRAAAGRAGQLATPAAADHGSPAPADYTDATPAAAAQSISCSIPIPGDRRL